MGSRWNIFSLYVESSLKVIMDLVTLSLLSIRVLLYFYYYYYYYYCIASNLGRDYRCHDAVEFLTSYSGMHEWFKHDIS